MGTSSSRHKTSDSNKFQAITTTPTEQKKSKFDIFLKSWRAEIGEFTDKFDNLNSKEQNIIQEKRAMFSRVILGEPIPANEEAVLTWEITFNRAGE